MNLQNFLHAPFSRAETRPVIVVEDCEEDFAIIREGLSRHATGQPVMHFNESRLARDWLENNQDQARLILLDLNMPGESGNSLLETIKSHPAHKLTPVIVLSSSDDPRDVAGCYRSGANSYHTKPLETENFFQTMQKIAEYWLSSAYFIKA